MKPVGGVDPFATAGIDAADRIEPNGIAERLTASTRVGPGPSAGGQPQVAADSAAAAPWLLWVAGLVVCGSCVIGLLLAGPIGLLGSITSCVGWLKG